MPAHRRISPDRRGDGTGIGNEPKENDGLGICSDRWALNLFETTVGHSDNKRQRAPAVRHVRTRVV